MTEGAQDRRGFSAVGGRDAKAAKIAAILAAAGHAMKPSDRVLDLGCGSGEIAAHLSGYSHVTCADVLDQRTEGRELPFVPSRQLPELDDATFDLVISNHVIEHTAEPDLHLQEIRRLLKPQGIAYLATPNRLWPFEPHTRLWLLHLLPNAAFIAIAHRSKRLNEPLQPLSAWRLQRLAGRSFTLEFWHHRIVRRPEAFALSLPSWSSQLIKRLPRQLLSLSSAFQPTLICLLTPA